MEDSNREERRRIRQEILPLLEKCKWSLVMERYSEAGEIANRISELFREIFQDAL